MEQVEVKDRESSIVLVGKFDPLTLAPHWFVKNGMIPQEDIDENLTIELVYKDITKFSVANVLIEVRADMVILRSAQASFDYKIHDLAIGILSSFKGADVRAVGLNIHHDLVVKTEELWHGFGDMLAPKKMWHAASPESPRVGMVSMQMQLNKPEGAPGIYNFSVGLTDAARGVRVQLNNHFDNDRFKGDVSKAAKKKGLGASGFEPVAIVSAYWQQTLDYHSAVTESLFTQAAEGV